MLSQQEPSQADPAAGREVFRSAGALILSWVWLAIAVAVLADLAVQGRDHAAAVAAAVVLTVTGLVYACAWRPRIVADREGIMVANPLRDHRVPWGAVTKIDVVTVLRVHCAPGESQARPKILHSWAVQASPRSSMKAQRRAGLSLARQREGKDPGRGWNSGLWFGREETGGAAPGGQPAQGYGQMSESARAMLDRTTAEFTAGRLAERAQQARQAGAAGGQPAARWAWLPIGGVALPVLLLVLVVLI